MKYCMPVLLLLLLVFVMSCKTSERNRTSERNVFVGMNEEVIRAKLGRPAREWPGHYGLPDLSYTQQFQGKIRTLLFDYDHGDYYVSFESRSEGWICISSTWVPKGVIID